MVFLKSIFCALIIAIPILGLFTIINIIIHYHCHKSSRENCKWKICKIEDVLIMDNLTDIAYSIDYSGEEHYTLEFTNRIKMNCFNSGIYVLDNKSYLKYSVIFNFKDYIKYYFIYKIIFRKAYKNFKYLQNQIKED